MAFNVAITASAETLKGGISKNEIIEARPALKAGIWAQRRSPFVYSPIFKDPNFCTQNATELFRQSEQRINNKLQTERLNLGPEAYEVLNEAEMARWNEILRTQIMQPALELSQLAGDICARFPNAKLSDLAPSLGLQILAVEPNLTTTLRRLVLSLNGRIQAKLNLVNEKTVDSESESTAH